MLGIGLFPHTLLLVLNKAVVVKSTKPADSCAKALRGIKGLRGSCALRSLNSLGKENRGKSIYVFVQY